MPYPARFNRMPSGGHGPASGGVLNSIIVWTPIVLALVLGGMLIAMAG